MGFDLIKVIAAEKPTFWMIAGPNGSEKGSLYGQTEIEAFDQSIWIINPDFLTARIRKIENLGQEEANLEAVIRIELGSTLPFVPSKPSVSKRYSRQTNTAVLFWRRRASG